MNYPVASVPLYLNPMMMLRRLPSKAASGGGRNH